MKITFGLDFGSGSWPGPLTPGQALVGEIWVGPAGFLGALETALGLGGPWEGELFRAAALIPAVQRQEGFWSASAEENPLATARTLLRWRDELMLCGWQGEAVSPRLEGLAGVTEGIPPGFADRLRALHQALALRPAGIGSLRLLEDPAELPVLWQNILQRLEGHGTAIDVVGPSTAAAAGDLAASRNGRFRPQGDGSLRLVRPHGPLAAAEEVAAWLASQGSLEGTLLIGTEPVLDQALRRYGLPTTGAPATPWGQPMLQNLSLVLELGWQPPDPDRVLELLSLPATPIPPSVAGGLIRALQQWPALGSELWRQAVATALDSIDDPERRKRFEERLQILFTPTVPRSQSYPVAEVRKRTAILKGWLGARLAEGEAEPGPWLAAQQQCAGFECLIERSRLGELSAAQLQRFVREATGAILVPPPYPQQAGLAAVEDPGAVAGEAARIVWWSFNLGRVPQPAQLPLTAAERRSLRDIGVEVPDLGQQMLSRTRRWRRPLLQAREHLLLICPQQGEDGDRLYPHPLWDEIVAGLDGGEVALLEGRQPPFAVPPRVERPSFRRPPRPRRSWQVPGQLLVSRPSESPSSLRDLIGCSLRWALSYGAKLRQGRAALLPAAELLRGLLAHEITGRVIQMEPKTAAEAGRLARDLFDRRGPELAAAYFLPGNRAAQEKVRRIVSVTAERLVQMCAEAGLGVMAVEEARERPAAGGTLRGRPDLVLGPPTAVVDLKWRRARGLRQELLRGGAYQLAAYSYLLREDGAPFPPVAYLALEEQALLSADPNFPGAELLDGPSVEATWKGLETSWRLHWQAVSRGLLIASGNPDEAGEVGPEEDALDDEGKLVLRPPCRFCEFGALCGRSFGEN